MSSTTETPTSDRRSKGWLEAEVQRVTNEFAKGKLKLAEGELLTPHRISKRIAELLGPDATKGSPGAITNTLKTWGALGFAEVNTKPLAFVAYTELGKTSSLAEIKEVAHARLVSAKAIEREAVKAKADKEAKAAERAAAKAQKEADAADAAAAS